MRLVIVRHAIAVPRGTPDIPDEKRPLTKEGRARFRKAARGIARQFDRPDALLTSPWLRAAQTAATLAKAWGRVRPKEAKALAGGTFEEQAAVLDRFPREATVAIVGHEPYLSSLLARLVGARLSERLALKKGGVAVVELPGTLAGGGSLVSFLPPAVLRRL
jgi:phosphohistidine phosphatase